MTRCPHCFQRLTDDEYGWNCAGTCTKEFKPRASALHGAAVYLGPTVRQPAPEPRPKGWTPTVPLCTGCKEPMREACPHCHYPLPSGWRQGEALCIAMAGARATGKSVYIGVLVKQVRQYAERLGTVLQAATQVTERMYADFYEAALFKERGLIQPTPAAQTGGAHQLQPLIFDLGMLGGRRRYLVFRDVAGEDLENAAEEDPHLKFFSHADGVIFMLDPLRVPEIQHQLQDLLPAQLRLGGDSSQVLTTVLRLIDNGPALIAVALSKFDAMQALSAVPNTEWSLVMSNAGAGFLRDAPAAATAYDEQDGELLHLEVRSLLQKLGAGEIVTALENPNNGRAIRHRFFAVSALGESAEGEMLNPRGISPFRCLDPLRWIMTVSGALP